MDFLDNFNIEKNDDSTVKITGEIPYDELEKHRNQALAALGKNVEIDGFRKGHVPENILVERVGELNLLSEMAERAIASVYPKVVEKNKLEVIGHPKVEVTKIAPQNPLGFSATVAVLPEITLPNYKEIAAGVNKEKASPEVTDEDVEKQIEDILRQKIAYERIQKKANSGAKHTHADGTVHDGPAHGDGTTDLPTPESEAAKTEEETDPEKIELPELTDEYVKTLGQPGQFESVADFKSKIKEHLEIQKKQEVEAAHRAKLTDEITAASQFELPKILVESELNQMFAQMNEDLARANLKMEDYLNHIKKTREDLQKEWEPAAEKRARLQLVLNEIAKVEDVKPDPAELEQQVENLIEQHKDADEMRVRVYVASVLTNEAVMKMLEAQ